MSNKFAISDEIRVPLVANSARIEEALNFVANEHQRLLNQATASLAGLEPLYFPYSVEFQVGLEKCREWLTHGSLAEQLAEGCELEGSAAIELIEIVNFLPRICEARALAACANSEWDMVAVLSQVAKDLKWFIAPRLYAEVYPAVPS